MTWRGSTNMTDRIFSVLVYLFALYDGLAFGQFFLSQLPPLIQNIILIPVLPIALIYGLLSKVVGNFAGLLIFFILFLAVVNNYKIKHFIRFNTMQTILIGIVLSLISLIMAYILIPVLGETNFLIKTLSNAIFITSLGACFYSMFQSARGRYAELPVISEAVYYHVR